MSTVLTPPDKQVWDNPVSIFLAGSIEMGRAQNWQDMVIEAIKDIDVAILNPRRADWDSSWEQTIDNPEFYRQVQWELNGIEAVDLVVFYFDPTTKSPITLMELGLCIGSAKNILVCCPQGFYRKGNVDISCKKYSISQVPTLEELIKILPKEIDMYIDYS